MLVRWTGSLAKISGGKEEEEEEAELKMKSHRAVGRLMTLQTHQQHDIKLYFYFQMLSPQ